MGALHVGSREGVGVAALRAGAGLAYPSLVFTLLTFEIFRGSETEADADRLRRELESGLTKRNWAQEAVHTTFTKERDGQALNRDVVIEFQETVAAAHEAAGLKKRLKVRLVALNGPGAVVAQDI